MQNGLGVGGCIIRRLQYILALHFYRPESTPKHPNSSNTTWSLTLAKRFEYPSWLHCNIDFLQWAAGNQHTQWSTILHLCIYMEFNWGEPERDPHRRVCCGICLCYIYRTSCRKSLPALVLRVSASFVNSKTIHQLTQREGTNRPYLLDGNSKDGDYSWTYLFND